MNKTKKLSLNKDTVRVLSERESELVDGALIIGYSVLVCNNNGGTNGSCVLMTAVCW